MEETKPLVQSKSAWAGAVALVAWLINLTGHEFPAAEASVLSDQIAAAIHAGSDLIGVVSTMLAMYWRVKATRKIEGVVRTPK